MILCIILLPTCQMVSGNGDQGVIIARIGSLLLSVISNPRSIWSWKWFDDL